MNTGMKSGYARTESSCHHMCDVSKPKCRTRRWTGSQLAKTPKKRRSRASVRQTASRPPAAICVRGRVGVEGAERERDGNVDLHHRSLLGG